MPRLANFSGAQTAEILQKHFGFFFVSQKGSHRKLRRLASDGTITAVVPMHSELAVGTLRNILRQSQVSPIDFLLAVDR